VNASQQITQGPIDCEACATPSKPTGRRPGSLCRLATTRLMAGATVALLLFSTQALADDVRKSTRSDAPKRVEAILEQIKARYVEPIDDDKLVADAVNGVLKTLDSHSVYLDAEAFRQMQQESRGLYGGVGMEVGLDAGSVKVLSTFEGTPAFRAGLQPGDVITRVEGAKIDGMSLDQVTRRVRGEPETEVALTILRQGEPGPRTVTLTRETIQGRSVKAYFIEPGYIYVRVTQFQMRTAEMMAKDVARLLESDPAAVNGVILDLRDNPGGVLSSAVGVSAAFLPSNAPIVYTAGAATDSNMRLSATRSDYMRHSTDDYLEELPPSVKTLPMVVLVNNDSASAAEIVAGALQDNKRATVLGTQTYGKGSIQVVIPFGDGTGMKLTTAYYYTPSGRRIQGKGVTPDIVVEEKFAVQLAAADVKPVAVGSQTTEASNVTQPSLCEMHGVKESEMPAIEAKAPNPSVAAPFSGDCQLEQALRLLRSKIPVIRS
jgi:carboxyl-terminal processing protease